VDGSAGLGTYQYTPDKIDGQRAHHQSVMQDTDDVDTNRIQSVWEETVGQQDGPVSRRHSTGVQRPDAETTKPETPSH